MKNTAFVRGIRAVLAVLIMNAAVCTAYAAEPSAEQKMDAIQGHIADALHGNLWLLLQMRDYKLSDVNPNTKFKSFLSKDKNTWIVISVYNDKTKTHTLEIWMHTKVLTKSGFTTQHEPLSIPDAKVNETLALYETEAKNAIAAANKVYDDASWWKF